MSGPKRDIAHVNRSRKRRDRVPPALKSSLVCVDCGLKRRVRPRELDRAAVIRCHGCGGKMEFPGLVEA